MVDRFLEVLCVLVAEHAVSTGRSASFGSAVCSKANRPVGASTRFNECSHLGGSRFVGGVPGAVARGGTNGMVGRPAFLDWGCAFGSPGGLGFSPEISRFGDVDLRIGIPTPKSGKCGAGTEVGDLFVV